MFFLHMLADTSSSDKASWPDQQCQKIEDESSRNIVSVSMDAVSDKGKISTCQPEVKISNNYSN